MRDRCDLVDRCDLWLELPTPELAEARQRAGTSDSATAFLRFGYGGLTFALPDVPAESEGRVAAVPVLWSDALGRGVEPASFAGEVTLCFVSDGVEGWRCSRVEVSVIDADGGEHPVDDEAAAREWLRP
jgi:hypothetical protein